MDDYRVENVAKFYLREIRKTQPDGPYFIGGLSFGGLVAFEIAQQLKSIGQEVALVILFDTPTSQAYRLKPVHKRIQGHLNNLFKFGWPYFQKKIEKFSNNWANFQLNNSEPSQDSVKIISKELRRKYYQAGIDHYELKSYLGKLILFMLEERNPLADNLFDPVLGDIDPFLGWGEIATEGIEVFKVAGDHTSMFEEPYVSALAKQLKICLEKAQTSSRSNLVGSKL
jgi:thioesterase domain-containing protein